MDGANRCEGNGWVFAFAAEVALAAPLRLVSFVANGEFEAWFADEKKRYGDGFYIDVNLK